MNLDPWNYIKAKNSMIKFVQYIDINKRDKEKMYQKVPKKTTPNSRWHAIQALYTSKKEVVISHHI